MEDLKLTPEEVQNSVLAAYDSVNLINDLKAKESLTEDEQYKAILQDILVPTACQPAIVIRARAEVHK